MLSLLSARAASRPLLGSRAASAWTLPSGARSRNIPGSGRHVKTDISGYPARLHVRHRRVPTAPPALRHARRGGAPARRLRSRDRVLRRPRAEFAYVVRRGSVELSGGGRLFDLVGGAEMFGFASLLAESPPGFVARAAEDPLVYAASTRARLEAAETEGT